MSEFPSSMPTYALDGLPKSITEHALAYNVMIESARNYSLSPTQKTKSQFKNAYKNLQLALRAAIIEIMGLEDASNFERARNIAELVAQDNKSKVDIFNLLTEPSKFELRATAKNTNATTDELFFGFEDEQVDSCQFAMAFYDHYCTLEQNYIDMYIASYSPNTPINRTGLVKSSARLLGTAAAAAVGAYFGTRFARKDNK